MALGVLPGLGGLFKRAAPLAQINVCRPRQAICLCGWKVPKEIFLLAPPKPAEPVVALTAVIFICPSCDARVLTEIDAWAGNGGG
jgi:hypothetical protein